ncbi:Fatty-acid-CoA ligase [Podila minutissima]|uniref:Fatty-acid-CoA ligase n=1 Tax=Podila minutissima TaxID=64525 RepID=A0A9P5VL41_9FUNG|nr:Fatty-acid-CoA ligase [Podila minutissima]
MLSARFARSSLSSRPRPALRGQYRALAILQPDKAPLSYVRGPTDSPLCEDAIGPFWDRQVNKYGDRLGLVVKHENNLHWTFRQFGENVDRVARGLFDLGLRKGDRLAVWMPNNSAWATLQYATAKNGVILVTLNPAYRREELLQTLALVDCKALIAVPALKSSNYCEILLDLLPELGHQKPGKLITEKLPSLRQLIVFDNGTVVPERARMTGAIDYNDVARGLGSLELEDAIQKERDLIANRDIINLQFTSGTTGRPKGVSLSHRNILNNGIHIGDNMKLTEKDILCCPPPLFHCFGLVLGSLAAMTHGSAIVYPSESFNAEATLKAISEERCTANHGVPTMITEEMNHANFDKYDLSSLRTGIAAGSPVPIATMHDVITKMHMKDITISYGFILSYSLSCTVVDPATGETLPINVSGELCTRGYTVMEGGYWNSEAQTKETIDKDGYLHTGDTAVINERGLCRIDGRIKDIVIRGGEKIHPVEVENCLFELEGIQTVSVIGVPDDRYGEQVCAWITNKRGHDVKLEDVQAFCKGRIAHYKVPKYLVVVEADEIPKTPSGKIQKNILRERSKMLLNL